MILLWGLPSDGPLRSVSEALRRLGRDARLLDQRAAVRTEVRLEVGTDVYGCLRCDDMLVNLASVSAFYLRPYDSRQLQAVESGGLQSRARGHAMAVEDILLSWADLTPARVVNRPEAMAANGSKPFQLSLIRSFGFEVPPTLVTTDPLSLLEFFDGQGPVIYKSLSGVRSIVARFTPGHLERLADLASCPTQFQRQVQGTDYRIHVVGDDVFACRITTDSDDYRYAAVHGGTVRIEACDVPEEVCSRCHTMVADMGLLFAGVDLRETEQGEWFCFEVNPSPAFTYYQDSTGQPIDLAVAGLLSAHH